MSSPSTVGPVPTATSTRLSPGDGHAPLPALALDLPGFGASPPPPAAWGAEAYAELVGRVLDEMGSPVVVLGHSFGGRVALHLAVQRPDVGAARWCSPACRCCTRGTAPTRVALAYRVTRRLHAVRLVSDDAMEAARQRFGSADYRAAQGIMRQVLVRAVNETDEAQLDAVRCPVHLVWGADDTAAPLEVAERAVTRLAQGDLAVHPGVGHLTPLLIPGVARRRGVMSELIGALACAAGAVPGRRPVAPRGPA